MGRGGERWTCCCRRPLGIVAFSHFSLKKHSGTFLAGSPFDERRAWKSWRLTTLRSLCLLRKLLRIVVDSDLSWTQNKYFETLMMSVIVLRLRVEEKGHVNVNARFQRTIQKAFKVHDLHDWPVVVVVSMIFFLCPYLQLMVVFVGLGPGGLDSWDFRDPND